MSDRQMISCFKGLAPVSMPTEWLEGFDAKNAFAYVGNEARIRFLNGKAFGVTVHHNGPEVSRTVRALSAEEMAATSWGAFCSPWESYQTSKLFGHGPTTALDQVA
ncbi:hypothetical protein A3I46_02600 [Candidatus Kaiserbacteria bacterium RIFCSPLOWO2_02_FULL_54_13]|nr:MAG: hypothetical protein UY91_C0027G0014 [Parcubacteria group bacterium GW2011_GWB1_55_9]OGG83838.1 MAG: hypothetical protein A3I46_02600 [Candidatus Kaiserbacteria bacterium RIFCSPLOWO2_02_FULL_54_13]OGG90143.1 MAG: hypothetical protein A3G12_03145 [Candidatus Kaiserbacteria bacterium RIFCSPLOWO2_12_FULL_54_10]